MCDSHSSYAVKMRVGINILYGLQLIALSRHRFIHVIHLHYFQLSVWQFLLSLQLIFAVSSMLTFVDMIRLSQIVTPSIQKTPSSLYGASSHMSHRPLLLCQIGT